MNQPVYYLRSTDPATVFEIKTARSLHTVPSPAARQLDAKKAFDISVW
jgi:hypothetical protein